MGTVHPIPDPEIAHAAADREPSIPDGIKLYERIEGLVGEEAILLAMAKEHRREEHRERLREIIEELDRTWEHLRERAERRGDRRHLDAKD